MSFILYYEKGANKVSQWYVPKGSPVDRVASELGIIAMSLDRFPGIGFGINSPVPTEDNPAARISQ